MSVGWFWSKQWEKNPISNNCILQTWSQNCESITYKNQICYIYVFFLKHILNTQNERGGLLMMVSSMFFFFAMRFDFFYRGPLIIGKQFSSRWPAELHLLLVLFGGGPKMVEWDIWIWHTHPPSENKRMRANTFGSFFFCWEKKRVVFCFKRLVQVHLLKIWAVFFWGGRRILDWLGWIMLNLSSFSVGENLGIRGTNLIFGGSPRDHLWPATFDHVF